MEFNKLYTTIDVHSGGEPLRIITGGLPFIHGQTSIEQAEYFRQYCDQAQKLLMSEPRGHLGMVGCVVTPPTSLDADFGVLFMQNGGLSAISGHGIIGVVTGWLETGQLQLDQADPLIRIDSPAGRIVVAAELVDNEVVSVAFDNVPSFVYAVDVSITLNGLNERKPVELNVDIVFGGDFYAIVELKSLIGVDLHESQLPRLQSWGGSC